MAVLTFCTFHGFKSCLESFTKFFVWDFYRQIRYPNREFLLWSVKRSLKGCCQLKPGRLKRIEYRRNYLMKNISHLIIGKYFTGWLCGIIFPLVLCKHINAAAFVSNSIWAYVESSPVNLLQMNWKYIKYSTTSTYCSFRFELEYLNWSS